MPAYRLRDLDRIILQHCEQDSVPLQDLLKFIPRGTLYRHVGTLLRVGVLAKRGRTYRTTEQGKRRLAELTTSFDWNIWDRFYFPMTHIPSAPHRALAELMAAAVVARRAGIQEDHHPAFVAMGPTWWSSFVSTNSNKAAKRKEVCTAIDGCSSSF